MEQNYLLTYDEGNMTTYAWFYTEEELKEFVEQKGSSIIINEAIHILNGKEIELEDNE